MSKIARCVFVIAIAFCMYHIQGRDEEKIVKACYWPNEIYEPCFGGCAEVSCDNPRNHLRPCYPYCEPGCVCEDPYVRDDRTHQCVLPPDCSPTQMGIPVPTKKSDRLPVGSDRSSPKYTGRSQRAHARREELMPEFSEPDAPPPPPPPSNNVNQKVDEFKRPSEVSRMGNYFNIVIAPPPIKALQPRKMLQGNGYSSSGNGYSSSGSSGYSSSSGIKRIS